MQILLETILFCLAIIAPALLASSFKSDSAGPMSNGGMTAGDNGASGYEFSRKPAVRWLARRKRQVVI